MAKDKDILRWGVRAGDYRAGTWFANAVGQRDVYLFCRELGNRLHCSMHETGQWHVAFESSKLESLFDEPMAPEDRFIAKWQRPAAPVALACRIITPAVAVTTHDPKQAKVTWVPVAPPGMATVFSVVHAECPPTTSSWPGQDQGARFVGVLPLGEGNTSLYAVVHEATFQAPAPFQAPSPKYFSGASEAEMLAAKGLRMIGMNVETDGTLTLVEGPVSVAKNTRSYK